MSTPIATQVLTRAKLSAAYRINVAYGGPLAGAYAHARAAPAHGSIMDKEVDAQAEVDRVSALFATLRSRGTVLLRAGAYEPGQVISLRYPRYGLTTGKPMLIIRVDPDRINQTCRHYVWY